MNKRFFSVCLVIVALVASSNAFASRARQQVMGTADPSGILSGGTHGSLYYDDNYNIFYNPSYVNDFKNWVAIEKSNAQGASQAEGGFVWGMNNMAFGFFMNRGDATNVAPGGAATITRTEFGAQANPSVTNAGSTIVGYQDAVNSTAVTRATNSRPIDFIWGMDSGIKLGVGVNFASYKSTRAQDLKTEDNDLTDLGLRVGAQIGDLDPFLSAKIIGKNKISTVTDTITENKASGFGGGLRYHYGEWVPFAAIRMDKVKRTVTNGGDVELKGTTYDLGFGRNTKLGEGTHLNYALSYTAMSLAGQRRNIIPFNLGVEHDLTSWLVARGGFEFHIWDRTNGASTAHSTVGRLGATIKAGKANIDWTIGGGTTGTAGTGQDSNNFDFANGMFTTASLTYAW